MAESIRDKINYYRQKLDDKIKALTAPVTPEPKAPPYPEDATPVMTHLGTTYMHVWLDTESKPPKTCMRLRNGYLIRLDQRITQPLAIALLKLPYVTATPQEETAPATNE